MEKKFGGIKVGYKDLVFDKKSLFLVTGGAGFIGSNLCEAISSMGYNVRCLDDLSTGKQKNVDFLKNCYKSLSLSLCFFSKFFLSFIQPFLHRKFIILFHCFSYFLSFNSLFSRFFSVVLLYF